MKSSIMKKYNSNKEMMLHKFKGIGLETKSLEQAPAFVCLTNPLWSRNCSINIMPVICITKQLYT